MLLAHTLKSKVAKLNNAVNKHQESQQLNPFSHAGPSSAPKPSFNKDEYGKPVAGSLTEWRGQKANVHVYREMMELCGIINQEGLPQQHNPHLKFILFRDLFDVIFVGSIYTYISNKVVGLLLRARKYNFIHFEGEILFQRRDDDVPIFMLKTIDEIKHELEHKQDDICSQVSAAPKPTTIIQDNCHPRK